MHERSTQHSSLSSPAGGWPAKTAPTAARKKSRASMTAVRVVLTVVCPLAAASVAVLAIGPRFRGTVAVSLESASATGSATGKTPQPDERVGEWADELAACAWRHASRGATVVVDAEPSRLLVTLEQDRLSDLHISLAAIGEALTARAAQLTEKASENATQFRQPLADEQHRLNTALAELARDPAKDAPQAQPGDLLGDLLVAVQDAEERRMTLARLRARQESIRERREALLHAPSPTTASVDPNTRRQAYAADTVLQQDLRHLEVQLTQVRSALLEVWQNASSKLDDTLAASEKLENLLDAPEALSATGETRATLERIVGLAADHHLRMTRFAQVWTQSFVGLQAMNIDPTQTTLLDASDRLAEAVRKHIHDATGTLSAIRHRLNDATERIDTRSQGYALFAVAQRRFRELEAAQRGFDEAASDLYARDNYLLDAALYTARALLYRTGRIRDELDAGLNNSAKEQARAQRQRNIADLTAELAGVRENADRQVDELLEVQARIGEFAIQAPADARADSHRQILRSKRAWLTDQLGRTERMLSGIATSTTSSIEARVVHIDTDEVPANLTVLLVAGGSVWGLAFLGMLLVWRLSPAFSGTTR